MNIEKVNLVYFSPTQTSKKVIQEISKKMGCESINDFDLTLEKEPDEMKFGENELTIFGVPVYAGRVPPEAKRRVESVSATGSPAVVMVSYGNREYEDALLELKDIVEARGFKAIAGCAFIGEHSFSTENKPIAPGRPDEKDLDAAAGFAAEIRQKLDNLKSVEGYAGLKVPGNNPYKDLKEMKGITPVTREEDCTLCNECAEVCPTSAIDAKNPQLTDGEACIRCCACVKNCPSGARVIEHEIIMKISDWLHENFSVRKEPVLFL